MSFDLILVLALIKMAQVQWHALFGQRVIDAGTRPATAAVGMACKQPQLLPACPSLAAACSQHWCVDACPDLHPLVCSADGFDPLGLGANEERLAWFAESERVHCRWAMLGVAGILAQVRGNAGGRSRAHQLAAVALWHSTCQVAHLPCCPGPQHTLAADWCCAVHAALCCAGDCEAGCVLVHQRRHRGAAL